MRSRTGSAGRCAAAAAPDEAGRALARTLFAELGFRGNTDDYYDPRNSFLADVLDRKLGIPITPFRPLPRGRPGLGLAPRASASRDTSWSASTAARMTG